MKNKIQNLFQVINLVTLLEILIKENKRQMYCNLGGKEVVTFEQIIQTLKSREYGNNYQQEIHV